METSFLGQPQPQTFGSKQRLVYHNGHQYRRHHRHLEKTGGEQRPGCQRLQRHHRAQSRLRHRYRKHIQQLDRIGEKQRLNSQCV